MLFGSSEPVTGGENWALGSAAEAELLARLANLVKQRNFAGRVQRLVQMIVESADDASVR